MEGPIVLVFICCVFFLKFLNGSIIPRIINGSNATAMQLPHQVFYDTFYLGDYSWTSFWRPQCGGTIISSKIILTAAHCFEDDPYIIALRIYFGAVNKSNATEEGQQRLIVDRKSVVIHQQFNYQKPFYNDIAIIKLPINVPFNEYIRPAKLPQPTNNYVHAKAIVSGWGASKV
ncbi:ovochymase-2-like [Drosophila guanche]|uniref:ovochymase-2-like n=1 Tax=Drosophila guanche TaxID=7266 RepID=UPI0014712C8D|nr:ovochymase-2-like [Drosophila guanche]